MVGDVGAAWVAAVLELVAAEGSGGDETEDERDDGAADDAADSVVLDRWRGNGPPERTDVDCEE